MAENKVDEFDLGEDGEASASPDALKRMRDGIKELITMTEYIEQLEADLKAAVSSRHIMRTVKLPDIMAECQSTAFNHAGYDVEVSDFVSGSLPKDDAKRKKALDWLKDNEGAGNIKTILTVAFNTKQHNQAMDVAETLREDGWPLVIGEGVNAQTLQAFARERIRNGEKVDAEVLGLFVGKLVKIKKAGDK
jgi:hypothetical protein